VTAAGTSSTETIRRAWLAWAAVCVIWGTTYLGIKVCLETMPPFLMGGIRYVAAGAILAAILRMSGHALPARSTWGRIGVLGFFMLFVGNGGVVWGEQFIPSGLTAVLIGTSPFWMAGIDALVPGGQPMRWRQWIGLAIGFAGIVILVWPDIAVGGVSGRSMLIGAILVQLACLGWGIGTAYTRRQVMPKDVLGSAALQMLFGGLLMLAAGTAIGEWGRLSFTVRTASTLVYLILIGSVVAFAAFSYALQHLDVAIVSLYSYVNPVIAVALGTLLLDEPFHLRMLVAAAVIVAGIAIVGRQRGGATTPRSAERRPPGPD
jgi:drug/metabolite transporter (DMT)-like permease